MLIFFESSLTEIQTTCEKNNEKLLQNIEYIPLLDKRNTEHFAKHLAERWDFLLLEREISLLYQYTGGQMWLIKETLRQVHKHKISISEAFQSDELRAKTNKIWNKLSSDYKKTLVKKDLGLSKSISTLELKKLNLIQDDLKANNTAEFISELSERVTISIHYTSSEIFFNEINVTSFFSQQEFQLIQRFSENLNNILSREEVAKIFWPDGNYSDWALDKAISRFRKRLESLGISKKSVVTLREKGYQFLLNK